MDEGQAVIEVGQQRLQGVMAGGHHDRNGGRAATTAAELRPAPRPRCCDYGLGAQSWGRDVARTWTEAAGQRQQWWWSCSGGRGKGW